jgi:uncharacterized protein (TIGR02147 family)
MKLSIFDHNRYITYLKAHLEAPNARGAKAKLAAAIGVQATYISQVLQEKSHLSLEQAEAASHFLNHTQQEAHFFLLLVQKDRAGTKTLRVYFQNQIESILKSRMVLSERLGKTQQLDDNDRSWYYSSWLPSAIHIAVTIPTLRTVEALSKALNIPADKLLESLERLENIGLIKKQGATYVPGVQQIRLGKDSHHILKHHTNWRLQALQSLDREQLEELHYSAVVSLSKADVLKIKDIMLDSIKHNVDIIKDSKEEELYCYCLDFFKLARE